MRQNSRFWGLWSLSHSTTAHNRKFSWADLLSTGGSSNRLTLGKAESEWCKPILWRLSDHPIKAYKSFPVTWRQERDAEHLSPFQNPNYLLCSGFLHGHRMMMNTSDMEQVPKQWLGWGRQSSTSGMAVSPALMQLLALPCCYIGKEHGSSAPALPGSHSQTQHSLACFPEPKQGQNTLIHKRGQQLLLRLAGSTAASEVLHNRF